MVVIPTWDLFITLFFVIGVGYGVILQREKILATLISTYIALAVASVWGDKVFEFFNGNSILFNQFWIRSNMSEFSIKALLFAIIIVLLTLKGDFAVSMTKAEGMVSTIFVFIYSFLNTGLIVSSVINFLPATAEASIIAQSTVAELIMNYDVAWVVIPALLMIVGGFLTARSQSGGAPPPA
jgi:hypothetical protein